MVFCFFLTSIFFFIPRVPLPLFPCNARYQSLRFTPFEGFRATERGRRRHETAQEEEGGRSVPLLALSDLNEREAANPTVLAPAGLTSALLGAKKVWG